MPVLPCFQPTESSHIWCLHPLEGEEIDLVNLAAARRKKPAPVTWDVIKRRRKTDRDTRLSLSPLIPSLFLRSFPQSLFPSSSFHLSTFLGSSSSPPGPSLFPCLKLPVSFLISPLSFFVLLILLFSLLFRLRQTVCP